MDDCSPTSDMDHAGSPSPNSMLPSNHVNVNSKGEPLTGMDCTVCEEPASSSSFYRRHYGVICCEACKCFFRRTVQMSRDYKCRFGGKCYVGRHTENLKQVCQACRFNKCIQTGMKIDSVKKFPRKSRNQKGGSSQEEGKETMPSTTPTKSPKKTATKPKRQKKAKRDSLEGEQNGISLDESEKLGVGSRPSSAVVGSARAIEQDEELALSDTDLGNVKFKMSPSEAMLYLQSNSTSVSQLFKYDSVDSLHENSSLASPPNIEGIKIEGSDGHSYVRVVSGHSPDPTSAENAAAMRSGAQAGLNGCAQNPRREGSFRGKRGPEQAARAAMEVMKECGGEDPAEDVQLRLAGVPSKKPRAEAPGMSLASCGSVPLTLSNHTHSCLATRGSVSTPPLTPVSPVQPNLRYPHSQPSSRLNSPEPLATGSVMAPSGSTPHVPSLTNNRSAYTSPYVTPHGTPVHTPYQSPLPSPSHTPTLQHQYHGFPSMQQTSPSTSHYSSSSSAVPGGSFTGGGVDETLGGHGMGFNMAASSPSAFSSLNLPGFSTTRGGVIQLHQQHNPHGTILLNSSHAGVPVRVVAPTAAIFPATMVFSTHHTQENPHPQVGVAGGGLGMTSTLGEYIPSLSSKSPFRIVPIPSINRTQPEELPNEQDSENLCDSPGMYGDTVAGSTSSSACPSPVHSKPKTFSHLAEAKLEEVLDSLRLRIRSLFTWAKSDVNGFDDMSPLDQKALLRRTVPELVMLGFAKCSVPYDNLLMLGSTGKVIRPTNQNNGVASVALVTLQKLVVPLKILNINDRELVLLKEIVLFNPESNGLRNREVVRLNRKQRHLKLMEYTEKSQGDHSRFGELMCLLTPLFEVSTEVTEQLRLEQFVHEGEARIDALLLMSMINVADEIPDVNTMDTQL